MLGCELIVGAVAGAAAAVPAPLAATVVGALLALLPTVIVALAAPAAVGVNVTLNGTLCPGLMFIGKVGPAATNAPDDELTDDRIAVIPPVLVTLNVWLALLPTAAFPRLMVAGLADSTPGNCFAVPVALTATVVGALLALLPTVIVALAAPVAVGVNTTVKGTVCPGLIFIGKVGPLATNSPDDELTDERIAVIPPVLVTENEPVPMPPTATLPTLKFAGLASITPGSCFLVPVPLTAIAVGVPLASTTLMVPLAAPAALGENATVMVALCPAFSVIGKLSPLAANASFDELRLASTTAALPTFFTATDCEELLPTTTLPKLKFVGVADTGPAVLLFALVPAASTDPA